MNHFKTWLKTSNNPFVKKIFYGLQYIKQFQLPVYKPLFKIIYTLHKGIVALFYELINFCYWTPLFKSQLQNKPKSLHLVSGLPLLLGKLSITIGDHCRLSGHTTICGRNSAKVHPELKIGNNVGISWQNEIFVGSKIFIGNNVRMAVKVRLVGYPGHPMNAKKRALGLPDKEEQVGDIIIEDDVWLGAGVSVLSGVTIGKKTVVATGSIVTKSLPANVLAGGIPAQVIKSLSEEN